MNSSLRRILIDYKEIVVIVLLGLVPLTWFKAQILVGGDHFLPFHPELEVSRIFQIWDNHLEMGQIAVGQPSLLIPFLFTWMMLAAMGLSIPILQRIWLVCVFTLSAASMYYLISTMRVRSKVAKMASAFFYTFNLYVAVANPYSNQYLLSYAAAPLILGLFIRGLEKHSIKHSIYAGLASLLFAAAAINPPVYPTPWIILLVYFIYYVIVVRKKLAFALKYLVLTTTVALLVNLFWMVTFLVPLVTSTGAKFTPQTHDISWVLGTSENAQIGNCFRLLGSWLFNEGAFGSPYCSFAPIYATPLLIILTTAIPLLAFSTLLCYPRNRRVLFFSVLAIIGLFLATGPNKPLGNIYVWLYTNIPGFWIFREPWSKFMPIVVLSYASMIGFAVDGFFNRLSLFRKVSLRSIGVGAILILLIVNAWPLLSGDAIPGTPRGDVGRLPGFQVNIPEYWIEASNWINAQPGDWRVFLLPQNPFYQVHYTWDYYGVDITPNLVTKSLVTTSPGGGYLTYDSTEFLNMLYYEIKSNPNADLSLTLSILNAKYVLLRGDLDWTYFNTTDAGSPQFYSSWLDAQSGIKLAKVFGPLKIYENELYYPRIYAADDVFVLNGNVTMLPNFLTSSNFEEGMAVFLDTKLHPDQVASLETLSRSNNSPSISYKEISSTKYIVHVHDASNPFVLVFTDSFDPQWIAQIDDVKVNGHMVVNGYANAWYINKTGSFKVVLEFWPQKLFYYGATVSLATLIVCVLFLVKDKMKAFYLRYVKRRARLIR